MLRHVIQSRKATAANRHLVGPILHAGLAIEKSSVNLAENAKSAEHLPVAAHTGKRSDSFVIIFAKKLELANRILETPDKAVAKFLPNPGSAGPKSGANGEILRKVEGARQYEVQVVEAHSPASVDLVK